MAKEEIVYRNIPGSCIVVPGFGIPPVGIESSISKSCKLGEHVELHCSQSVEGLPKGEFVTYNAFPDDVPAQQLFHQEREEEIHEDPGKFPKPLIHGDAQLFHLHRVDNHWIYECCGDHNHDSDDTKSCCRFLGNIDPIDGLLSNRAVRWK